MSKRSRYTTILVLPVIDSSCRCVLLTRQIMHDDPLDEFSLEDGTIMPIREVTKVNNQYYRARLPLQACFISTYEKTIKHFQNLGFQ